MSFPKVISFQFSSQFSGHFLLQKKSIELPPRITQRSGSQCYGSSPLSWKGVRTPRSQFLGSTHLCTKSPGFAGSQSALQYFTARLTNDGRTSRRRRMVGRRRPSGRERERERERERKADTERAFLSAQLSVCRSFERMPLFSSAVWSIEWSALENARFDAVNHLFWKRTSAQLAPQSSSVRPSFRLCHRNRMLSIGLESRSCVRPWAIVPR